MGRALRPVRRVAPSEVRAGDVVMIRPPRVPSIRWMLVDYVVGFGHPEIWSGRWAFGADAGAWTIHAASRDDYTVKDARDARRDAERLARLSRNTHV